MTLGRRCSCGSPATYDNDSCCEVCYRKRCLERGLATARTPETLDGLIVRVNAWCRTHDALVVSISGAYFQGWQVDVRFASDGNSWRAVGQTHAAVLSQLELDRKKSSGAPLDRFEAWPRNAEGQLICDHVTPMPEDRPSTGLAWSHARIRPGPVKDGQTEYYFCVNCGLRFHEARTP